MSVSLKRVTPSSMVKKHIQRKAGAAERWKREHFACIYVSIFIPSSLHSSKKYLLNHVPRSMMFQAVVVHVTDSSTKHSFLASTPEPVTNHFIPRTSEEWNRLPAQLLWSRTTPATPGEKMLTSRLRGRIWWHFHASHDFILNAIAFLIPKSMIVF